MSDMAIVFTVLAVTVILFVWDRLPVEIVAIGGALVLAATGVLTFEQSISGFGDSVVIFIAALFVVAEGIDSTGIPMWAGQKLVAAAGQSRTRLIILMMLLVALLTAFVSVNGAVAALVPMVVIIALRFQQAPSQLLMPLAFGAHAGSLLLLTGTPIHILVSDAAIDAGESGFGYFSFALIGIPVVIAATAIVVLFGKRLLPDRHAVSVPKDLSDHALTLVDQYSGGDWVARFGLTENSLLTGMAVGGIEMAEFPDVTVIGVQRDSDTLSDTAVMQTGDVIVARGSSEGLHAMGVQYGLDRRRGGFGAKHNVYTSVLGVVETVIPPRSGLVGSEVFPGMLTDSGEFVILAVQRQGLTLDEYPIVVEVGDTMLIQGTWDSLETRIERDPDVLVVDSPGTIRRQALPFGPGAWRTLAVLVGMVVLLVTGVIPAAGAALLAAGSLILLRVVTVPQAYRAISWTTIVLVGGMIPLSVAVFESGAAEAISDLVIRMVGDLGPYALLAVLFVLTAVLGQLISNTATALIVIPIAVSAAHEMGISVRPVLMSVTVAAAAAFLTPVATAANLMVMGPGGYKFSDYWKLGLPMLALFMVASVFLVPVWWQF